MMHRCIMVRGGVLHRCWTCWGPACGMCGTHRGRAWTQEMVACIAVEALSILEKLHLKGCASSPSLIIQCHARLLNPFLCATCMQKWHASAQTVS